MKATEYDTLYIQFLYYFNIDRDYFECHEVMEHLWMEEGRNPLLQGLLQVAVGLYHFRNDNISGAIKLFTGALEKLGHHPRILLGMDLQRLLDDVREYRAKLERIDQEPFAFYDLDIVIVDPDLAAEVEVLRDNPPTPLEDHH